MPHFFFDSDDGRRRIRDVIGLTLSGIDDVESEVKRLTYDLAFAELLKGVHRQFTVSVRDEAGRIVYRGSVTLKIDRGDGSKKDE